MTFFSHGVLFSILSEETLALRKEGSGVVLDCQLPHLIGIDEDMFSNGIILYYLKVKYERYKCYNFFFFLKEI